MTDLAVADVLLANLGRGADQARTLSELAEDLRVSRRQIEASIQELRLRGWLVISGNEGCWLSFEAQEGVAMYRKLRSRYLTQAATARALLRTAQKIEASQLSLNL